jgi:cyclopropane fatty-acyl-phospholipid synthase-like methyltransferase
VICGCSGKQRECSTVGGAPIGEPAAAYDRFVSNYVFDLLSEEDIRAVIAEAYRVLRPGGISVW